MPKDFSPLTAIERIAQSEDRKLAIVFFLFFSRFEYALKRSGYLKQSSSKVNPASADWMQYAAKHPHILRENYDESLLKAVEYLAASPPKKQVSRNGELDWEDDCRDSLTDPARIFTLVCRIRNNLFHGGKFPSGPVADTDRDRRLIQAGIDIMQGCLNADSRLREIFLESIS